MNNFAFKLICFRQFAGAGRHSVTMRRDGGHHFCSKGWSEAICASEVRRGAWMTWPAPIVAHLEGVIDDLGISWSWVVPRRGHGEQLFSIWRVNPHLIRWRQARKEERRLEAAFQNIFQRVEVIIKKIARRKRGSTEAERKEIAALHMRLDKNMARRQEIIGSTSEWLSL